MGKLKIDGCPRCGQGVITLDKDEYGWYEYCLQCGYTRDLAPVTGPEAHPTAAKLAQRPAESDQ